jgi:hypothetical protein
MKSHPCGSHQARMSELTDDGLPFPKPLRDHVAYCPACAAFARICQETPHHLSGPFASAGEDLRRKILRLPQAGLSRPRFPIASLSAVAATILLAAAWWFTRPVQKAPTVLPVVRNEAEAAATEIAALKDDLDQALVRLAEPLSVFNSLVQP